MTASLQTRPGKTLPRISPRGRKTPSRDDDVRAAAEMVLRDSGYRALSKLRCESIHGKVILSGVVPSYYMKQMAQTIVLQLEMATSIDNRLVVKSR